MSSERSNIYFVWGPEGKGHFHTFKVQHIDHWIYEASTDKIIFQFVLQTFSHRVFIQGIRSNRIHKYSWTESDALQETNE